MTTASTTPVFHVRGELSQQAVAALARLLIDHARRELEAERAEGPDDHHHHQECQV